MRRSFDVAVAGAGLAGCAAAVLLARDGLRVALLERQPDPLAYKRICTHYIQASAAPTIERLGLTEAIEAAGGVRNGIDIWTRFGWIRPPREREDVPRGFSIRRERLDPMLRRLTAETPGVELMLGRAVRGLIWDGERVAGVEAVGSDGRLCSVQASLTVAADGRDSRVARLARVPARLRPNRRFAYFAYYRGLPSPGGTRSRMWLLDPDVAYAFPNDGGLTVLACFPAHERLPEFRRNLEEGFHAFLSDLPDGPPIEQAERVSPILGRIEMTNRARPAARPGLALVGDAALASDPLWGVGCGWALQGAELMAGCTAHALLGGEPLDRALGRYRRRHLLSFGTHHFFLCGYSSARRFSLLERVIFAGAAADPVTARHVEAYGERRISPWRFAHPPALGRALRHALPTVSRSGACDPAPARRR